MRLICFAAGLVSGAAVTVTMGLVLKTVPAIGSYSLADDGGIIIPSLLVPYVLFVGWTVALRYRARARDLAFFALGMHFGVGALGLLTGDIGILLFAGLLLVDGVAVVAGAGLWFARHAALRTVLISLAVAWVLAFVLIAIYHLVFAMTAGVAVAYVERRPARTLLIAGSLALAALVMAIVPITAQPPV